MITKLPAWAEKYRFLLLDSIECPYTIDYLLTRGDAKLTKEAEVALSRLTLISELAMLEKLRNHNLLIEPE